MAGTGLWPQEQLVPAWVGGHAVSAGSGQSERPGCLSSQAGTLGKRDLAGWLEASAGPGLWKEDSERPLSAWL